MAVFEEKAGNKVLDDTLTLRCMVEQAHDVGDHVEYVLRIHRGIDSQNSWIVKKRYSDFALLENVMKQCGLDLPFPPKKIFGNRDRDFIAERQQGLQKYIDSLLKMHIVTNCMQIRHFLDPGNYSLNIKERALQHISMLLRSEVKWEIIEPAPDIGWRIRKAYFFVKNKQEPKNKYLLSWNSLGALCQMESKDLTAIAKVLTTLNHPYIFPLIMCEWNENCCISVSKFKENGTLRDIICKAKPKALFLKKYCKPKSYCFCGLDSVKLYGRQILEALKFLHDKGIPYGNLHAGNVIVSDNVCQITDVHSWFNGTPCYYKPFIVQLPKIQTMEAIDVYCFGHFIYEISMGFPLNEATCDNALINCAAEIRSVIQSILSAEALKGEPLSLSDLLNHSLFKDVAIQYNKPQLKLPSKLKESLKGGKEGFEKAIRSEQKTLYQVKRLSKAKEFHMSDEEKRKRRKSKMKQLSQQMSEDQSNSIPQTPTSPTPQSPTSPESTTSPASSESSAQSPPPPTQNGPSSAPTPAPPAPPPPDSTLSS